ncbi:Holliday junction branch migration protein RuvA [Ruminococcus sp. OA3]|uniref:Holliday junction branch migration protein RuvA n=1 Tax=Ruminococcus sp. OA3 TaxID=2914164 RepID=UPI001F050AF0|nr:Holliday junction branch migration protein RuvA [Ruminococcus sp. OA3]MCH1983581.1 Holliday junction branch migration protein RuvA [Ruminococcus sp. OA3]
MIVFVRGEVAELAENHVVIDNNGIGYEIFMPSSMLACLRQGEEVRIHTYQHVKEDAMQLFGFLTKGDMQVFQLLIGVNGVGPKAGLGILSALSTDELRFAVLSDDAAAISRAPGIGKKTAQKIILELKDKMDLQDAFEQKLMHQQDAQADAGADLAVHEAVQALTALGYSNSDALRAVKQLGGMDDMDAEAILKAALKKLI